MTTATQDVPQLCATVISTATQFNLLSDNMDTLKGTHRLQVEWPSGVLPSMEVRLVFDATSDLSLKQSWDAAERDTTTCGSS